MASALMNILRDKRLPLAAGLVLLVGAAVVHGLWTDRWNDGQDLERALARLDWIPLNADPWKGRIETIEEEQADAAARVGIPRIVRRQYVNETTHQAVSVILMCGRFGPLSVHTPDVCYGAAGYVIQGRPERLEVAQDDGGTAVFWTARFHKPNAPATPPLRIIWGWNASSGWLAPDNPRWTFRRKPVLYKLYLAREMTTLKEPLDEDPSIPFLRSWLPELDRALLE
jgi:hypothetical protein